MLARIYHFFRKFIDDRKHRKLTALSVRFEAGAAHVPGSSAYAQLNTFSLALSGVRMDSAVLASVNLVLPTLSIQEIFAGIQTALEFGCKLAANTKRPLRLIKFSGGLVPGDSEAIQEYLCREFGRDLAQVTSLHVVSEMAGFVVNKSDYWVGTYWTTSHALDVASRLGVLESKRVIYLVQDYEPGFFPWSSDFALARSTYHAGFHLVINSSLLHRYLTEGEGVSVETDYVFSPSIDLKRLERVAHERRPSIIPRFLFYARPSKPRNLYAIGIAALHLVAEELRKRSMDAVFLSAGESHPDVQLSSKHILVSKGKLGWAEYFATLSNTDIVLSLQYSPHPSHPPIDAVTSGCIAVTNEMGGTRSGLHPRLLVAEPNPNALALEMLAALDLMGTSGKFDPDFSRQFGLTISSVVVNLVKKLDQIS